MTLDMNLPLLDNALKHLAYQHKVIQPVIT